MFEVIGIVGSLASIVALFLPANSMKNRLIHAAYVLVIVIVTTIGYSYKNKLERIESAERAATVLLEDRRNKYSSEGFNMAALSFWRNTKIFILIHMRVLLTFAATTVA